MFDRGNINNFASYAHKEAGIGVLDVSISFPAGISFGTSGVIKYTEYKGKLISLTYGTNYK